MGNPYSSVTVTNYNTNPPEDDGSQVSTNEVKWSTHKTKIGDPLKTAVEAVNSNASTAFGKVAGGITTAAVNYTILAADQGKLIVVTNSGVVVTTPVAATVGSPFRVFVANASTGDITIDGNGSETIDGDATITVPAGYGVGLDTNGTNWFTHGQNFNRAITPPQGYLTITSGVPVISSDVTAATAVYYTPVNGNYVPISDGTDFFMRSFSELTLSLHSNHVANTIYDVFVFNDSGTIRIGTGPAWNSSAAGSGDRGTGAGTTELERFKGFLTNAEEITARNGSSTYTVSANRGLYVGSIFIDGTNGQISCHVSWGQNRKWGIWNAFNRRTIFMKCGDSTAQWSDNTSTIRAANGDSSNKITIFAGLDEEWFDLEFIQNVDQTGDAAENNIYVGYNSTTAGSGLSGTSAQINAGTADVTNGNRVATARYLAPPAIGIHDITALERGTSTNFLFLGTEPHMLLSATYMG